MNRGALVAVVAVAAAGVAAVLSTSAGPGPASGSAHVEASVHRSVRLRVASFNAWGVPFGYAKDLEARVARMPKALKSLDADVISIQEAWLPDTRRALEAGLAPEYHAADAGGGGLVLLSRLPLSDAGFLAHPDAPGLSLIERIAHKGVLVATVATSLGPVRVIDVHCTAFDHPSRDFQLRHLVDEVLPKQPRIPTIVAGDMNLDPTLEGDKLDPAYASILAAGFSDAFPPHEYEPGRFAVVAPGTWGGWPREDKPDSFDGPTLDHVFVRGGGGFDARVVSRKVDWRTRDTALSDHNLLLVEVEVVAAGR